MKLEKVDTQEEFKKQANAFLPRAELQETIQIGQEALLQREEILSKAEDSDDGKRNSLESLELENAHVHQIPQTVANIPKELGNQEVAKEGKRLQNGMKLRLNKRESLRFLNQDKWS
jgi:hypothetical protein